MSDINSKITKATMKSDHDGAYITVKVCYAPADSYTIDPTDSPDRWYETHSVSLPSYDITEAEALEIAGAKYDNY